MNFELINYGESGRDYIGCDRTTQILWKERPDFFRLIYWNMQLQRQQMQMKMQMPHEELKGMVDALKSFASSALLTR